MNKSDPAAFFVGIFKKEGVIIAHTSSNNPDNASTIEDGAANLMLSSTDPSTIESGFYETMQQFTSTMEIYESFIPMMLGIGPAIVPAMSEKRLEKFAIENGEILESHTKDDCTVYKLSTDFFRDFSSRQDEVASAVNGAAHLPKVMIIGLISSYDAFLSNLLRNVFSIKPDIIFSSERTLQFSEISKFSSMQEARQSIIDKEIDSVLRKSHHEHFKWMENNFNIKLRVDLDIWPQFIEICERRNLLTHTGGVVSQQYLDNCSEHKCAIGDLKVGDTLNVNRKYYSQSVSTFYEIGVKLCYVLWRKFCKPEVSAADVCYNGICFELILKRRYSIAENLLKFGVSVLTKQGSDRTRRMLIVNLALVNRLSGREANAIKIIDAEDWSASSNEFKICASAAKGDIENVVRLMRIIGANDIDISSEEYREWPVFRDIRKNEIFIATFKEIFSEELIRTRTLVVPNDPPVETSSN